MASTTLQRRLYALLRLRFKPSTHPAKEEEQGPDPVITSVWSKRTKLTVAAITAAIALLVLFAARDVVPAFVWATVIAYIFTPMVSLAKRHARIPRPILVFLLYAFGINAIFWVVWLVRLPLAEELNELARSVPLFTAWVEKQITGTDIIVVFGQSMSVEDAVNAMAGPLRDLAGEVSSRLFEVAVGVFGALFKIILSLVAAFYLLLAGPRITARFLELVPDSQRVEVRALMDRLNAILGAFVRGQLLLVVIASTFTYIGLTIVGIPFALVLAVAAGVLDLVPIVGPIVAAIPSVLLAAFGDNSHGWPGWVAALVVVAMYTVYQQTENYVLIPNVVGRVINLHPFVALFALFAGASIWGVSGMILALPAAAVARILLAYVYQKLIAETRAQERSGT